MRVETWTSEVQFCVLHDKVALAESNECLELSQENMWSKRHMQL